MRKRLLKDIIIPKGTIFNKAPARTERYGEGHFDCVVGLSTNTSGHFEYYIGPCSLYSYWITDKHSCTLRSRSVD